jgi:hypothetical protein
MRISGHVRLSRLMLAYLPLSPPSLLAAASACMRGLDSDSHPSPAVCFPQCVTATPKLAKSGTALVDLVSPEGVQWVS